MRTLTTPNERWGAVPYAWVGQLLCTGQMGTCQGLWHFKMAYYLSARCQKGACVQSRRGLFQGIAPADDQPSRSSLYGGLQTLREAGLVSEVPPGPGSKLSEWRLFEPRGCGPLKRVWRAHTDTDWIRHASPTTIRVFWALTRFQNFSKEEPQAKTWPSVTTLADTAGVCKRTVQGHLRKLEAAGVIETHAAQKGWKSSTYFWATQEPVLQYWDGEGWRELTVTAVAQRLEAAPDEAHWCCAVSSKKLRRARKFRSVEEAPVRVRYG